MANAIDLGSALKVTRTGDTSNYPDTVLSGCADPTDFNNATKGDGGDVVSGAAGAERMAVCIEQRLHLHPAVLGRLVH